MSNTSLQVNFQPIKNAKDMNSAVHLFQQLTAFPTLQNELHAHIIIALDSGRYRFDIRGKIWRTR